MIPQAHSWVRNQPGAAPPSSYKSPGMFPAVGAPQMPPNWAGARAPATSENMLGSIAMRNMPQGYQGPSALGSAALGQVAGLGGSGWQPGRTAAAQQVPQAKSWVPDPVANPVGSTPGFDFTAIDLLSKTAGAFPTMNFANLGQTALMQEAKVEQNSAIAAPAAAPVAVAPARKCREGCVMRLNSSTSSRQHPSKQSQGIPNADATEESPRLLAICDGVSGCAKMGISPDTLPHELLSACRNKSRPWLNKVGSLKDCDGKWLRSLMEEAYNSTRSLGATTMLLASVLDNGLLMTANVGDCSLLVLRVLPADKDSRTQVVFRTQATRYEATKPVQVQRIPNMPESRTFHVLQNARCDNFMLQPGDYLVLGSDGLFDNLQEREIREIIERTCPMGGVAQTKVLAEAARILVDTAISHATQAMNAKQNKDFNPDDTTALVASAVEVPDADEFDRWFWRSRGIQQPYQDSQPQLQRPESARLPSNRSAPPPKTSQARGRSLERMPEQPLQDCTNTAAQSNDLRQGKGKGKGNEGAGPGWWSNLQVPNKPQTQAQAQKYGERGNLAAQAAQAADQNCEDGDIAQPRLTSQVLRAHEAKMAVAPSLQHYPNVPRTNLVPPGQKPGGWGLPGNYFPRQNTMTTQNEQCVIS